MLCVSDWICYAYGMNFTAVDNVPSKQTVQAYIATHQRQKTSYSKAGYLWAALTLGAIAAALGASILAKFQSGDVTNAVSFTVAISVIVIVMFFVMRSTLRFTSWQRWRRATQLDQFARDNGLNYIHDESVDPIGSMKINVKNATYTKMDTIVTPQFEIGTIFAKDPNAGRGNQSRQFGYVRIPLGVDLPNMLLVAKSQTGSFFGTNAYYTKNETIKLEGDFDKYFTLIAPAGCQELARYFFTPDTMALFIDNDQSHTTEIVDGALYINIGVNWYDHTLWDRAQQLCATIGAKMAREAEVYQHANAANAHLEIDESAVATPSQSLVRRQPLAVRIFSIVLIIFAIISLFLQLTNRSSTSPTSDVTNSSANP